MPNSTSKEDAMREARRWYDLHRAQVETSENIGKMVIIDVETGHFGVDSTGFTASRTLRQQNPNARLIGLRIGYDVAASLGGVMERTAS